MGATIVSSRGNEAGALREYCNYLSAANVAAGMDKPEVNDNPKDFSAIINKISQEANNKPFVGTQIYRGNAGVALISIKTAARMAGGNVQKVPGPWDEAYFGPSDAVFVARKGSNGVLVNISQLANKHETGVAIAKELIAGL